VLIIIGRGPPETIRWFYCGGRLTAMACAPVLTAPKGRSAPVLGHHRQPTHRSEPSNGLFGNEAECSANGTPAWAAGTIRWFYCGGRLTAMACAPVLTIVFRGPPTYAKDSRIVGKANGG
jgi:hypothetical protein